jgi:S1-C subfamily serine protease
MAEFLETSGVDGVVDGGAAARAGLDDLIAKLAGVAGESLQDLRLVVEGHHEGFVFVAAQNTIEKADGSVLFEVQAIANAVGGV